MYFCPTGDSIGIDVATVHHGNQFLRYNISMLAYGFYGDCIVDSDSNRWMGPKRYDWAGEWGEIDGLQYTRMLHEHHGFPHHKQLNCLFNNKKKHQTSALLNPYSAGTELTRFN